MYNGTNDCSLPYRLFTSVQAESASLLDVYNSARLREMAVLGVLDLHIHVSSSTGVQESG